MASNWSLIAVIYGTSLKGCGNGAQVPEQPHPSGQCEIMTCLSPAPRAPSRVHYDFIPREVQCPSGTDGDQKGDKTSAGLKW